MKHKSDIYLGTYRILRGTYRRERAEDLLPIDRSRERLYGLFGGLLGWTFLVSSSFLFYFPFPTINMH